LEDASLLFHFLCPEVKTTFQKGKLKLLKGKGRQLNKGEESDIAESYRSCWNAAPGRAVHTPTPEHQISCLFFKSFERNWARSC